MNHFDCDAVVVGSGPNGLSAAIRLAQKGKKVRVFEAQSQIGGAARSGELTLPGFVHDLGSAIHPLAICSPFLGNLPLTEHGLRWVHSPLALAHPLDDGTAVTLSKSIEETAEGLDAVDRERYREIFGYLTRNSEALFSDILAPLKFPKHPILMSRFGMMAILSTRGFVDREFKGPRARALFAGLAAHSFLKFSTPASGAIGLVLAIAAHTRGWPMPEGGAGKITQAMASYLKTLGGEIIAGHPVETREQLSKARAVLLDLHPKQILQLGGEGIPAGYRSSVENFKPGPGVFKLDYVLSGPLPWKSPECARAATVHLGGGFEEMESSEEAHWEGKLAESPFVLLAQPTLFDRTRVPSGSEGKHIVWAYCHVPYGSRADMTDRIEAQIERFAPGFKQTILHRTKSFPADLEKQNRNLLGGDISGGAPTPMQLFFRPAMKIDPYRVPGQYPWWICSASTPPGPGVHGMCGFHAAESALKKAF